MGNINWQYSTDKISTHFSVNDALYLHKWGRLANESDGLNNEIKENLINLCAKMEVVRHFLGDLPIIVQCTYRPEEYNKLVKGATNSAHKYGMAMDFVVQGYEGNDGCDKIRSLLVPKLEEFGLRMEDISDRLDRTWIHIDVRDPVHNRYFKP